MRRCARWFILMGILFLAACSETGTGGFGSGSSFGTDPAGAIGDPTSPAYFQSAIGDRVVFEIDQSSLTEAGRVVLDGQADWLLENGDYSILVEGHADEQGTRAYNLALGARRANAVREYLSARGVAGSRIQTVSFGKERPIELCSRESCYSVNRRAVTLLDSLGS